jgi:hypothetical protein
MLWIILAYLLFGCYHENPDLSSDLGQNLPFGVGVVFFTKGGRIMKKLLVLALVLVCGNCWAGPYIEFGSFYTDQPFWVDRGYGRMEESGIIGHVAAGYEIESGKWITDLQLKHESDPEHSGDRDLTAQNSIGISFRYKFSH